MSELQYITEYVKPWLNKERLGYMTETGAVIAANDIRTYAKQAIRLDRPDVKALILDALRDGLKVLEEERES